MKTVVFVGGTAYSGSTFLNMILGNDPKAFACGEVRSLFHPSRSQHVDPRCNCGDPSCIIWQQVATVAENSLYEVLFRALPEVDYVVDSSKNPFWIQAQSRRLRHRGIQVKNILIWKTPLEFAFSCKERNRYRGWDRRWIDYHQLYFSLVESWRAVAYSSLVHESKALERVCEYVEMPYFEGKERYWEKTQHGLFGNYSARFHLYSKEAAVAFLAGSIDEDRIEDYRKVYYKDVESKELRKAVEGAVSQNRQVEEILQMLEQHEVSRTGASNGVPRSLRLSGPHLLLRKVWHFGKTRLERRRAVRSRPDYGLGTTAKL